MAYGVQIWDVRVCKNSVQILGATTLAVAAYLDSRQRGRGREPAKVRLDRHLGGPWPLEVRGMRTLTPSLIGHAGAPHESMATQAREATARGQKGLRDGYKMVRRAGRGESIRPLGLATPTAARKHPGRGGVPFTVGLMQSRRGRHSA